MGFKAENLIIGLSPNEEQNIDVLPPYLFDAASFQRSRFEHPSIRDQSVMDAPYWLPREEAQLNEAIGGADYDKIGGNIDRFLPYSFAYHYQAAILQNNQIQNGSLLHMF